MAMERRSEELKANGSRRIKPRRRCSVTRPAMEAMTQIRIAQHGNNKHSISTISTVCQEHAGHLESNTFIRIKFEIDDTSSRLLLSSNGREKVCGSHGFRDARVRTLLAGIAWQCGSICILCKHCFQKLLCEWNNSNGWSDLLSFILQHDQSVCPSILESCPVMLFQVLRTFGRHTS